MFTSILEFAEKKERGEPVSMVTCYDYTSARILAKSQVDSVLVGDSVAMVIHGYDSTVHADLNMMKTHVSAVRRGLGPQGVIVADMPFLANRKGVETAIDAAGTLVKAGANAVKIEGVEGHESVIHHIIGSGIPVMGHLGLLPQSVNALGGYKVQGRDVEGRERILRHALELDSLGVFGIVLECIPQDLADEIRREVSCSVIGIGAGPSVDGQVLVWQDLLGMNQDFKPRFAQEFSPVGESSILGLNLFHRSVKEGVFPSQNQVY